MASIIYRGLLTWEYLAPPKGFFGVGRSEAGVLCAGDLGRFPVGNLIWETVRTSSSALQPFWLHTHETYSQSHWTLLTEERQTCFFFLTNSTGRSYVTRKRHSLLSQMCLCLDYIRPPTGSPQAQLSTWRLISLSEASVWIWINIEEGGKKKKRQKFTLPK